METIKQIITTLIDALWRWLGSADEQTIYSVLMVIASSVVVSYIVQHFKRRYSIDVWRYGRQSIYALLGFTSAVASLADWYILQNPSNFGKHYVIFGMSTYILAKWVHAIHTTSAYDRITAAFKRFADNVAAVREAKGLKPTVTSNTTPNFLQEEAPATFEG